MGTSTHQYPVKYVSPPALTLVVGFAQVLVHYSFGFLFSSNAGDLLPVMCDRAGFIQDTSLILYEVWTACSINTVSVVVWGGLFSCVLLPWLHRFVKSAAKLVGALAGVELRVTVVEV